MSLCELSMRFDLIWAPWSRSVEGSRTARLVSICRIYSVWDSWRLWEETRIRHGLIKVNSDKLKRKKTAGDVSRYVLYWPLTTANRANSANSANSTDSVHLGRLGGGHLSPVLMSHGLCPAPFSRLLQWKKKNYSTIFTLLQPISCFLL